MKIKLPIICLCLIAAAVGGKMSVDFKSDQPDLQRQAETVSDQNNNSLDDKSKTHLALKISKASYEK